MTKIIKQIGAEGRTTIPQNIRDVLDIRDGDFISFEVASDGRSIRIVREQICPYGVAYSSLPQKQKRPTSTKKSMGSEKVVVTRFIPEFDEKAIQKALFVLGNILGMGGDEK